MHQKPVLNFVFALLVFPFLCGAQNIGTPKSAPTIRVDSLLQRESHVWLFQQVGVTDTTKSILRVLAVEAGKEGEPIQGATVLIRRDKDRMLGRVTKQDGRCSFVAAPAEYIVRVQMTGLKSLEKRGFVLEAGKAYEMKIVMMKN